MLMLDHPTESKKSRLAAKVGKKRQFRRLPTLDRQCEIFWITHFISLV